MAERPRLGTPQNMCGYCETAWDIIMGRSRPVDEMHTAWHWLLKCSFGGCDPECWNFLSEDGKGTVLGRPPFSKTLYHRRDKNVPWDMGTRVRRTVSRRELQDREVERLKKQKEDLALFESDTEEEEVSELDWG